MRKQAMRPRGHIPGMGTVNANKLWWGQCLICSKNSKNAGVAGAE